MTLLVCPVRPGDDNEELRYALRSWETNLILPTGLSLAVVGHCPTWLAPEVFIEGNRHTSASLAVWDNILLASAEFAPNSDIEEVVFMNDDFFCLDPTGAVLPVKRNISLAEHIKIAGPPSTWWGASLRLTASWLAEQGFPHPDSYEVHRPLVAAPGAMLEALSRWGGGLDGPVPQWRTVYGVLNQIDAYPVADGKLGMRNTGIGSPWISTSDQNWRIHAPGLRRRFQKPSRWEITTGS